VQGQTDLLSGFRSQCEIWPFRCKAIFSRFAKRYELRSNKVANTCTVPAPCDEEIVGVSECPEACGECIIEILEIVRLPSNLTCHALDNGKEVL
jgi:hypothetical protein